MKEFVITRKEEDYIVQVDDKYSYLLEQYNWHIDTWGYARRNYIEPGGKICALFLHNIIWFLETGEAYVFKGKFTVDHIDKNPRNNQIINMRKANATTQMLNRKTFNKTGFKGVSYRKTGKKHYMASYRHKGKTINCGSFYTPEEAHEAYKEKFKFYRGYYPLT